MGALNTFNFSPESPVRVHLDDDGSPWFVLSDVSEALGMASPASLSARIPDSEKGLRKTETLGGVQEMTVLSEAGLYEAIFRSNKPSALRFRRWVFSEVLPELRRKGYYEIPDKAPPAEVVEAPISEREVRHPDGRVVIERFDTGQLVNRNVTLDQRRHRPVPGEPEPIEVKVDVETLRQRFHLALTNSLGSDHEYQRLSSVWRGKHRRKLNSDLKAFTGKAREEWGALEFHNAVYWLLANHDIDIRWVLDPGGATKSPAPR